MLAHRRRRRVPPLHLVTGEAHRFDRVREIAGDRLQLECVVARAIVPDHITVDVDQHHVGAGASVGSRRGEPQDPQLPVLARRHEPSPAGLVVADQDGLAVAAQTDQIRRPRQLARAERRIAPAEVAPQLARGASRDVERERDLVRVRRRIDRRQVLERDRGGSSAVDLGHVGERLGGAHRPDGAEEGMDRAAAIGVLAGLLVRVGVHLGGRAGHDPLPVAR